MKGGRSMGFSVGLGLTNDCNLHCAHCYRPTDALYWLSLDDVQAVVGALDVASIGLGTGENALHPQFVDIVQYLHGRGIKLSLASNGHSLNVMPDELLRAFHDVEVSIDFPAAAAQDAFRGVGNWQEVHRAMARCQRAGLTVSILATMMNTNFDQMDALAALARSHGVNLRVNAYQPVQNGGFTLSYEQFWEGYGRLLGAARLLSCTEPVVRAALGIGPARSPCGHESVRVTPQRQVAPCVYWLGSRLTIDDLVMRGERILQASEFRQARLIPAAARDCACQGGCASRRALLGDLNTHDLYCPWVRGDKPEMRWEAAPSQDLVRSRNYCTTIVM
jgi:MoaA/NifB/PqqE/SkfB family radical SAM enzyme